MSKLLVIIDMQNDFIDGTLPNIEAKKIIPNIVNKINNWDGDIISTYDTHTPNYLNTLEGQKLPVEHCIFKTNGWELNKEILEALKNHNNVSYVKKPTFGSIELLTVADKQYDEIEICGTVASICVISNALLLRAKFPNTKIVVHRNCIADFDEAGKEHVLYVMKNCQIDIEG